jgi:hypothetical protein
LQEKVAWFHRKASEKASQVKRKLSSAWFWCIEKVKQGCAWLWRRGKDSVAGCRHALRLSWFGLGCAWKFRRTSAVALGVGTLAGVGSYLAGPEIASAVCGLSGAAMTVAGMILWPLCRLLFASNNNS